MDQQTMFKSSMFGFDKKMVLDYIYKIGQEGKEREERFNTQMGALEGEKQQLSRRVEDVSGKLDSLSTQLAEERATSTEAARLIQSLTEEIDRQKRISSDKEREIQIQNERCRQLQFKAESLEFKSKKYEEISKSLGDILLEAQTSADQLVAQAQEQALAIAQSVQDSTLGFEAEYAQVKDDLASMRATVLGAFDALEARMGKLDQVLADHSRKLEIPQEASLPALNFTEELEEIAHSVSEPLPPLGEAESPVGSFFRGASEN